MMAPIQSASAGRSLVAAIERNHEEWLAIQGRLPGIEIHVERGVRWIRARARGLTSHVFAIRLEAGEAGERLEAILAACRRLAIAPASVWVTPSSTPADLAARLRRRGLRCVRHAPAMAIRFAADGGAAPERPGEAAAGPPVSLSIETVADWSCFDGLEHPFLGRPGGRRQRGHLESPALLAQAARGRVHHVVARLDGVPVGVGTLFRAAGVGGIYDLGVVESCRRRGVGGAVTRFLVALARERGCEAAVLLATGAGARLYRRLGFEEVARFSQFQYSRTRQRRELLDLPR